MASFLTDTSEATNSTSLVKTFGAAVAGGAVLLALGTEDGVVLCPYRRCTGGDCPLCGVTRASARLVRGDVAGSLAQHPLVVFWALQLPLWLVVAARSAGSPSHQGWWQRNAMTVLFTNIAIATVVWIVRLIAGDVTPPTELTLPW